jgi:hypothetical protein
MSKRKAKCFDEDCIVRLQDLTQDELDLIYKVLTVLDEQMHSALHYEERYSKKHGYKYGHYWLKRKIDQVIGMAIQDVHDHTVDQEHT